MSNFNIYNSIKGDNHFGDIYNFSSQDEFYSSTKGKDFSSTEKELLNIIFENTTSEDERKELLNSLKTFKIEPTNELVKQNHISVLNSYVEKGKKIGNEVLFQVVNTYLAQLLTTISKP